MNRVLLPGHQDPGAGYLVESSMKERHGGIEYLFPTVTECLISAVPTRFL